MSFYMEWGFSQDPFEPTALPPSGLGQKLLVGRSKELAEFCRRLRSSRRIITIEGQNGIGKTSLANVGAYECFEQFRRDAVGPLLIPCLRTFQLRHDLAIAEFSRGLFLAVGQTLIEAKGQLQDLGRQTDGVERFERWLGAAQAANWQGSVGAYGFGAGLGRGPAMNEGAGYEEAGFRHDVLSALSATFGAGEGIVCVIDNLELLESSDFARRVLEELRDELFSVPGLRWVLAGAGGIIDGVAGSPRLEGYLSSPIQLEGIGSDLAPAILRSRIEAFTVCSPEDAYLPLVSSDFASLCSLLANNIRSALGRAANYCEWVAGRDLPKSDQEKHNAFDTWLTEESGRALEAAERIVSPRAWQVFDTATKELDGYFSPSEYLLFELNSSQALRPYVRDLETAGLLRSTRDDSDQRRKTVQVVAKGWLVQYARTRRDAEQAQRKS